MPSMPFAIRSRMVNVNAAIFLDVRMPPGIDGYETARRAFARWTIRSI